MADRVFRSAVLALVLIAPLPVAAADCPGLSRHFDFCDAGTDWAAGDWEQFGDGATLHLGDWDFDFAEDWAGRHAFEAPTIAAALQALSDDGRGERARVDHLADAFATPDLSVVRQVQTLTFEDETTLRATMIAEGGGQRILLMLNAPPETPIDLMERRSREIAALVRPAGDE